MERLVFTFVSTAAVCALVSATPALAAGADARGGQNQAQLHPDQANQPPVWSADGVAEGEVYPADQAYGRGYGPAESAGVAAAAPFGAAGVVMQLPFGASYAPTPYGAPYSYAPAPYGADGPNVPGRLSPSAALARGHVIQDFNGSNGEARARRRAP
jgi:hypothetical protein